MVGWCLDPHPLLPVEPTNLASSLSPCQFGLARLVSAGRRPDAAILGRLGKGQLVPTSTESSGVAAACSGAVTPSQQSPARPGACAIGVGAPAPSSPVTPARRR